MSREPLSYDFGHPENKWKLDIWSQISHDALNKSVFPVDCFSKSGPLNANLPVFKSLHRAVAAIKTKKDTLGCVAVWQHKKDDEWMLTSVDAKAYDEGEVEGEDFYVDNIGLPTLNGLIIPRINLWAKIVMESFP